MGMTIDHPEMIFYLGERRENGRVTGYVGELRAGSRAYKLTVSPTPVCYMGEKNLRVTAQMQLTVKERYEKMLLQERLRKPEQTQIIFPPITDEQYESLKKRVRIFDQIATTTVQRELKTPYSSAKKIMKRLETDGYIEPNTGTKYQKVLQHA